MRLGLGMELPILFGNNIWIKGLIICLNEFNNNSEKQKKTTIRIRENDGNEEVLTVPGLTSPQTVTVATWIPSLASSAANLRFKSIITITDNENQNQNRNQDQDQDRNNKGRRDEEIEAMKGEKKWHWGSSYITHT